MLLKSGSVFYENLTALDIKCLINNILIVTDLIPQKSLLTKITFYKHYVNLCLDPREIMHDIYIIIVCHYQKLYPKVSATWLPKCDLSKDNTHGHDKADGERPIRPQSYRKNYRKWREAWSRKGGPSQGRKLQLVVQYQIVNPENIHRSNIIYGQEMCKNNNNYNNSQFSNNQYNNNQ